jgi:N utilization substance protein B
MTATGPRDPRRQAREIALQMLYEWEVGGTALEEIAASWRDVRPHLPADARDVVWPALDDEVRALAERLAGGTAERLATIDARITEHADNWRLERMPVVDRLVLRLAVFELIATNTAPPVVINEAIELARRFSTEAAVKFVNGVLDAIARAVGAEPEAAPREPRDTH